MIEFTETGADDVVGIRIDGKVTIADIDAAIEAIDGKLAAHPKVSFIAEVDGLSGISPAALLKDIGYGIQQLTHLDRFYRAAVVTDKKWIRAAVKFESRILPGVEVKAFGNRDREAALTWVKNASA